MTSDELNEALEVTAAGLSTVFLILVLLVLMVIAARWVLETAAVRRLTGALAAEALVAAQRERAQAAAIGVSVALSEVLADARREAREESPG